MFQIASDLHLDFYNDIGDSIIANYPILSNTIVLAGDISESIFIYRILCNFSKIFKNVVYVPGNHDYYHSSKKEFDEIKKSLPSNVYPLIRDIVTIDNQRFIGATLWTDIAHVNRDLLGCMFDMQCIPNYKLWASEEHRKDREFLKRNIIKNDIVITHHGPSYKQIIDKYKDNKLNVFFVSNQENIILNNNPKYWISGHTHCAMKYMVGTTQVIVNPMGYPTETTGFNSKLSIE